jgi:hypothetical protein
MSKVSALCALFSNNNMGMKQLSGLLKSGRVGERRPCDVAKRLGPESLL